MRRIATTLALVCVVAVAGCETRSQDDPAPTTDGSTATPDAGAVAEHESSPQSPISFGLEVPEGATQLGPLVRYRSAALIEAFQPELDDAQARRDRAAAERAEEEAEQDGATATPSPSTSSSPSSSSSPSASPTPSESETPSTRPSDDTFSVVESPPRPDVTVSLMRIDGDPTQVVRRMIAQINAVLPDAGLVEDDLSQYCRSQERRITGCTVQARGLTADQRDISVTLTADPGELTTRTAYPASDLRPVMTVRVAYLGDPRSGQLEPRPESAEVPREVDGEDRSGLIWPSMDVEQDRSEPLLEGRWTVPDRSTLLLSGDHPRFAAVAADRVRDADSIAEDFVSSIGEPTKDVVEDLNEISTTYTARGKDGSTARATFVLSARGNYAMLFYSPPPAD